jgi:membrane-associated phospholipid phosphatase
MPKRLLRDQEVIWTSPAHLKPKDAIWLVPFGITTGMLIASDQHTMTQAIHINASNQQKASNVSNGALVGVIAIPAGGYLWSLVNHAPQAHETGLLAGEAMLNSYAVNVALKAVFQRDRPLINNAAGNFFSSGPTNSSFPSNHSVLAWSAAAVFASEYPGWLTRAAVYGLASTVSVSRVLAEQHFPSDVLVGSVTGWLIGRYVYHAHHNYSLNPYESPPLPDNYVARNNSTGSATQLPTPPPPPQFALNIPRDPLPNRPPRPFEGDPDTIGSTNVPMDSWIYPALERLGALGLIPTQNVSIRPWTRQECLRQLRQADELTDRLVISDPGLVNEAKRLMTDLDRELSKESTSYEELAFESAYARVGTIAGPALYDSFHFGQTWWNDYGRPLGRGTSAIAGFSTRAHYGRLFFYAREELQYGPGRPDETLERNQLINKLDRIQATDPIIQPVPGYSAYTRQRPIELYGGVAFAGNTLSFGKQQLYWGPTTMGPFSFSSNAEPTYNFRFVSTRPHPLPLVPSWGTYRFDIVLGKLSGHSYPARPWFNGQKISLNFGDNLEIGFTRWSVFWGVGHPITIHSFKENLFSFNSTGSYAGNGAAPFGDRNDPGDRKSGFDFRYHLPFLRKLVTLYADSYSDDDPSPIDAPRRAAWNPGIYFARLPWLPHMDLRVEAASTQGLPTDYGGQFFFMNNQYLDSNTNKGFLLGNAVGRDGRAIEATSGYWFSSRTRVEAGYRQNKIGIGYLPGGGTITDGFAKGSYAINRHWSAHNTSGFLFRLTCKVHSTTPADGCRSPGTQSSHLTSDDRHAATLFFRKGAVGANSRTGDSYSTAASIPCSTCLLSCQAYNPSA